MKFIIRHDIKGRLRVHLMQESMTYRQADTLAYYLENVAGVTSAKVYDRTADAVICYTSSKNDIIKAIKAFQYASVEVPANYLENSGRALNAMYQEKLADRILWRIFSRCLIPVPVRNVITAVKSVRYIWNGIKTLCKGRIEVPVLDGTAIGVSVLRSDFATAGSVMFLLEIGELLEEWTHKKSVDDLARSMSLNIDKVWLLKDGTEVLIPASKVEQNDLIVVHMGNVIPFDGDVVSGEGMVNQATLTGESNPVRKTEGGYVYAGTVLEEGEITLRAKSVNGNNKYQQIVAMIEKSEKLKSGLESKAEHLADKLVPYTLAGTALVYLFTKNITKALSVLMVDFSCALKLSMPVSVLSAIREANEYNVTVKGGKFMEAMAEADTIVFDKTGTLTKGEFKVAQIQPQGMTETELLEIAALGEGYSTHPIANSIREAYGKTPDMKRTENANEIAGHGISITVDNKAVLIGNEKLMKKEGIAYTPCQSGGTVVYVACDGKFAGTLVISDTVKDGAKEAISAMKQVGVKKCVMLTGDRKEAAMEVAKELGIDEVHAELLPADKVAQVERLLREKPKKEKLAFVGDGINDAPVLTRADIGIAMGSMGSDAAIEAADVVLMDDDVRKIASIVRISRKTLSIVKQNIVFALGVKAIVLLLGAFGAANMWEAVFADVGVSVIAILNSMRALKEK